MRFWFGRKAAPADVRPCVPAWLGGEGRGGFARDYHAQFEEVFRRNPVGQRAVRLVAGMLGALPIYASEGDERAAAMRFRIQPQQANAYLALGLTTATGVTLDTGPLAEHVYVRGDGGYTASTGYTSNAGPTYPYQAGHFFWFERIGSVAKMYLGGTGSFETAVPYHTFGSDAGDTDRPKIVIRDQNATVRVIYYPL